MKFKKKNKNFQISKNCNPNGLVFDIFFLKKEFEKD